MTDHQNRDSQDAAALADIIQGLGEQHTIGCSSLEEDGSGCDCVLPAAADVLGRTVSDARHMRQILELIAAACGSRASRLAARRALEMTKDSPWITTP